MPSLNFTCVPLPSGGQLPVARQEGRGAFTALVQHAMPPQQQLLQAGVLQPGACTPLAWHGIYVMSLMSSH